MRAIGNVGGAPDLKISWRQDARLARIDPGGSIAFHPGIEAAPEPPEDGGEAYVPGSWLPVKNYRVLSRSERAHLMQPHEGACVLNVGVVHIPNDALRFIAANAAAIWADHENFWAQTKNREIFTNFMNSSGLSISPSTTCIGPNRRPSGLRSTTYDETHGFRIGLHIDSWDDQPLEERIGARNRFCINLGAALRHLYFVPLSVANLIRIANQEGRTAIVSPSDLVPRVLETNPSIGVLRLDVPPGYAYVAPTDTFIHDGGSTPAQGDDVILTWLGQFKFLR